MILYRVLVIVYRRALTYIINVCGAYDDWMKTRGEYYIRPKSMRWSFDWLLCLVTRFVWHEQCRWSTTKQCTLSLHCRLDTYRAAIR